MSAPEYERAVVYTPRAGDVVVLECGIASNSQIADLQAGAAEAFGHEVKVVVLSDVHFAGVVRKEDA